MKKDNYKLEISILLSVVVSLLNNGNIDDCLNHLVMVISNLEKKNN